MFLVEEHGDLVAAAVFGFGVQGLVDVADEVEEELERLVPGLRGEFGVYGLRCLGCASKVNFSSWDMLLFLFFFGGGGVFWGGTNGIFGLETFFFHSGISRLGGG